MRSLKDRIDESDQLSMKIVASSLAILSMVFVFPACVHSPQRSEPRVPASAANASVTSDPTYDTLVNKIVVDEATPTIAGVLEKLRKAYPQYLASHTLAYQSFSLHGSSMENPRAIVFGDSGNLVISFNGERSQKAYSNLEIMTFDKSKGFEFREITFLKEPHAEPSPGLEDNEIETRTATAVISKPNPKVCSQCHGENARPIFQPYSTWPGFYGSDDDNLYRFLGKEPYYEISGSMKRAMHFDDVDHELEGFKRYLAGKKANARYSQLPDLPSVKTRSELSSPRGSTYVAKTDEDYRRRANLALMLTFYDQIDALLFQRVMKLNPKTLQVKAIAQSLCDLGHPLQIAYLKTIDPRGVKIGAMRKRLTDTMTYLRKDDFGRIYDYFDGDVAPYYGYDDSGDPDIAPVPRRAQFIDRVLPGFGFGDSDVAFAVVMKDLGIDLTEYAINLRREPNFANGISSFWTFERLIVKEYGKRIGNLDITCDRITD